jgi:hypothetical protein
MRIVEFDGQALYFPGQPLADYVECLWYVNQHVSYTREKILPTGTVELIINFGGAFKLIDPHDPAQFELNTASWLVGLQTEPLINEPLAESHMIGARFKPGGAFRGLDHRHRIQ